MRLDKIIITHKNLAGLVGYRIYEFMHKSCESEMYCVSLIFIVKNIKHDNYLVLKADICF